MMIKQEHIQRSFEPNLKISNLLNNM